MKKFAFDSLHSEILEKELDVRHADGIFVTGEEFLKYNYRELTTLAVKGSAKQKEWLRNYLNNCNESLERESLQAALGAEQP